MECRDIGEGQSGLGEGRLDIGDLEISEEQIHMVYTKNIW
jgi:hypothetical protein